MFFKKKKKKTNMEFLESKNNVSSLHSMRGNLNKEAKSVALSLETIKIVLLPDRGIITPAIKWLIKFQLVS